MCLRCVRVDFLENRQTVVILLRIVKIRFVQTGNAILIEHQGEQGGATIGWAANQEHLVLSIATLECF
jgi:hypothetical protein